jgi:V8-like Glu-specific endopeptidase
METNLDNSTSPLALSYTGSDNTTIHGNFTMTTDEQQCSFSGWLSNGEQRARDHFTLQVQLPPQPDRDYKPLSGSVPTPVSDAADSPYCFVGKLEMVFRRPDGTSLKALGSGVLIKAQDSDDNGRYVLTCAHNLYDPAYGAAESIHFLPGYIGDAEFATHLGTPLYPGDYPGAATAQLRERSERAPGLVHNDLDYGLVKLHTPVLLARSDWPDLHAAHEDELVGKSVRLTGLYGWQDQDDMMFDVNGNIVSVQGADLRYLASTDPGSSGSPVMLEHGDGSLWVVGVHVQGGRLAERFNVGRRIDQSVIEAIQSWQN